MIAWMGKAVWFVLPLVLLCATAAGWSAAPVMEDHPRRAHQSGPEVGLRSRGVSVESTSTVTAVP